MRYPLPLQVSSEPHVLDFIRTDSTPTPTTTSFIFRSEEIQTPTASSFQFLPQLGAPAHVATASLEAGCGVSTNVDTLAQAGKVAGLVSSMGAMGGFLSVLARQEWTRHSPVRLLEANLSMLDEIQSELDDLERTFSLEGELPTDLLPETDKPLPPGETPKPIQTYEELKTEYRRVRLRVKTALHRLKVAGWSSWSVTSYANQHLAKARDLVYTMEALLQAAQTSTTTYTAWYNKRNEEKEQKEKLLRAEVELEHHKKISASDANTDIVLPPDLVDPEY